MGEGSAINAHIAEQIGDRINAELDIANEGQIKGRQAGSRCHAFVYCDGSNRGGNGGEFPTGPGGIGIEIEGGGVEVECRLRGIDGDLAANDGGGGLADGVQHEDVLLSRVFFEPMVAAGTELVSPWKS